MLRAEGGGGLCKRLASHVKQSSSANANHLWIAPGHERIN